MCSSSIAVLLEEQALNLLIGPELAHQLALDGGSPIECRLSSGDR